METPQATNVAFLPTRAADETAPPARMPPHNFEVEMGLLAALLANNRADEKVSELLRPEHFADARHGRIYDAIGKLA